MQPDEMQVAGRAIVQVRSMAVSLLFGPRLELGTFKHLDLGFNRFELCFAKSQQLRATLVSGQKLVQRQLP